MTPRRSGAPSEPNGTDPVRSPRVLLTGMSGTGKTTVVAALRERGVRAIDMDDPGWSYHDDLGHQRWYVDRLARVLEAVSDDAIVVSGCSEDQATLRHLFTHVVLLSAPADVIERRIERRTDDAYGKDPAELAQVMADLRDVEPLLRAGATLEIVTTVPIETIVERLRVHCGLDR